MLYIYNDICIVYFQDKNKFGSTDGTYKNKKLFSCPPNKGLFVSIDKLEAKLSNSFLLEYAKQLAHGVAQSRTFKMTLVGPEGSGKTSTIRTLLGKKFNPHEVSTIGAILGIQAIIRKFKGIPTAIDEQAAVPTFSLEPHHTIGWNEASADDMQQIRYKEFNKEMSSTLDLSHVEHASASLTPISHSTEPIAKIDTINEHTTAVLSGDDYELDIRGEEMDIAKKDSEQYSQAKDVVFGDKVDELDNHACISDFAGQLTFFSFQLFFLKARDTVIITFNASLELTAKIIPRERYDHARKKRTAAGIMTTIENIEFWLQSVSAHAGTNDVPDGCISRRSPTAILCATHAKRLSAAKMAKISEIIFNHLAGKPYANHLPTDRKKAIFFIDNKHRKKFKHNIIMLQEILLEAARPAYLEECPISYLRLEQLIAIKVEEGVTMISVVEFTALVNKAGIPGKRNSAAISAALHYCSIRGTILYFSEVELLSETIFISPQWLSSIFSKIITTHDQVVEDHSLYHAWKRFDKYAILEEQFLDHILHLSSVLEHKEIIISLMKSFNLLAKIPSSTHLTGESSMPNCEGRVFIVPALLLLDPDLPIYTQDKHDQVYVFYFPGLYFPESAFNQILVKTITWNVEKKFRIYRYLHYIDYNYLSNVTIHDSLIASL